MGTEVTKVGAGYLATLAEGDTSLEALHEHRVLPRMKVVASNSKQELKSIGGEGAVIVQPGGTLLVKKGEKLPFVPVLFFSEYVVWSDVRDKESPMIRARSFDRGSEIAAKAANPKTRFEEYEGGPSDKPFQMRYAESLCFAGFVDRPHTLAGTTAVLGFTRGEYGKGKAFINAILMRRHEGVQVPLWAQRWILSTALRDRKGFQWWGMDFAFPEDEIGSILPEADAMKAREIHVDLKELLDKQRLTVVEASADDAPPEDGGPVDDKESPF